MMARISKLKERIKKLQGKANQADFARILGVSQSRISDWYAGRRHTAEMYLRLAKLAPYPDNLWFLGQAGMDEQEILSVAEALLKQRSAAPMEGEIFRAGRFGEISQRGEPVGPLVPLPKEFVPNPASTVCLVVDEHSRGQGMAPFGLYGLDTSVSGTVDIRAIRNEMIMIRFDPSRPQMFPSGLYAGTVRVHRQPVKAGIRIGARLTLWPPPSNLEDDILQHFFSLGVYRDQEAMSGVKPEELRRRVDEIWERVGEKFPLAEDVNILGIIRAYFPSYKEDDSLGF